MTLPQPGKLIILSGPSGAGKSTVVKQVLARFPRSVRLSISATTRPPRSGETPNVDYYFLDPDEFQKRRATGEFLESCEVFGRGHWYGTLRSEVQPSLETGTSVILEIDVDGAKEVLKQYPDAITIFLRPSSLDELWRRLQERGTDTEDAIARRLEVARRELDLADEYQHCVINDSVPEAVGGISKVLEEHGIIR